MECVTGKWSGPRPKHQDYIYTARGGRVGAGMGTTFGNMMTVPVRWLAALWPPLPAIVLFSVCASRENANKSFPGQPVGQELKTLGKIRITRKSLSSKSKKKQNK